MKSLLTQLVPILFLLSPAFILGAEQHSAEKQRPNILFIFSDDHAYQAISAYGFGLNKTPNIDRIANEGMLFTRCLTTNSICGPSRATVLTGKYSHMNHFYNNTNSRFDPTQLTFPKLLQKAGYQTAIIGKWHLETDPTGFDFWEILPGQGQYYNPPMILNGQKVKKQGYITEVITADTLDWLKNKRDKSKPFIMMCQHKAPHRAWEPALSKLTQYDGVKFPEPPTLFDDYSGRGKAEHEQQMMIASTMNNRDLKLTDPPDLNAEQKKAWDEYYEPRNAEFRAQNLQGKDLVRWKYQRYLHDYFAVLASVDESVGQLLDYLKESGLDQNTIVVYSSDQGFYLGEHGWFDKRWIFEESLRTPLLVRWPGVVKPGTVNGDIVSNLDYAETILDAAGVAPPAEMQGRSFVPVLKGQTPADWRKGFYYHYYEHPAEHNVARHYGVITDRYKLVYFYEPTLNYWELFDLKSDPHELKSVYDDPAYKDIQKDLHQQLDQLRTELKLPAQDPPESMIGPRRSPAERGKALNAWVLEYQFDKEAGKTLVDGSGKNNVGKATGMMMGDGRNGARAAKFDGQACIDVPKSPSLNPAVGGWTVEATIKPEKPDGIILAQGGATNGYILWMEAGKAHFTVVGEGSPSQVDSTAVITGNWATLRAGFDESNVWLSVNGEKATKAKLNKPIANFPNDGLQIGADLGSEVLGGQHPKFTGLIESIRLFSGIEPHQTRPADTPPPIRRRDQTG
jgi:arylsulfatase A-like enzyme